MRSGPCWRWSRRWDGPFSTEEQVRRKPDDRLETVGLPGKVEVKLAVVPRLDWDPRTGKFGRPVSRVGLRRT